MLALVRVPYLSEYNLLDVREEPVVSSMAGYLYSIGVPFQVFDFHLDRSVTIESVVNAGASDYVIGVRGTGLHWKYAERVASHILTRTAARVVFFGQTGKLQYWDNPDPDRVKIVHHDERACAQVLGLDETGPTFTSGLRYYPYGLDSPLSAERRRLFKATIETTRGCHYGCGFCFINHGLNYSDRYSRRPNDDVLADMRVYLDKGVTRFWFYDSEFIGGDNSHYPTIRNLLMRIKHELPPVEIMIYSRADTLERFSSYRMLAEAGVRSVLLGIESLDRDDLKVMRKGQTPSGAVMSIRALRNHRIFCNLSFILFNRTATVTSLRRNIEGIAELFAEADYIYLGQTIYFSYAFESDWKPSGSKARLSGMTRLHGSTSSTRSPTDGVVFDPALEPFAEICRIINYEQIRKLCELTIAKETDTALQNGPLHRWAALLSLLTLNLMAAALDEFEAGCLTVETVSRYEDMVFKAYRQLNVAILPERWQHTITDHSGYFDGDWNGWERQIPTTEPLATQGVS